MAQLTPVPCSLKVFPLRLTPGMEIQSSLQTFVKKNDLKAAFVLTCVGSVTSALLRYATPGDGTEMIERLDKNCEITSLVGTVCSDSAHLHVTLGDDQGRTVSGHVMGDLRVYTTAEILLGEADGASFSRQLDAATGWPELVIEKNVDF